MNRPWLTIVGLGEDGPDGLSPASHAALDAAEMIIGPPRHLALLEDDGTPRLEWPVPFADGLPLLLKHRGRNTVVLASGDPFWFGAGSVIARSLNADEWRALPGPSTFSLAAARLGWPLERTACLGLHAAPLTRLRPHLAPGQRAILLLRDGAAVSQLAAYLREVGFGASTLHVFEALGGPSERHRVHIASDHDLHDVTHPVAVAVDMAGGVAIGRATGKPDDLFDHDGQITKQPIRAVTLATLAPKPGELLWDIGAGSGSIALEWLMTDPSTQAVAVEAREDRAARITANATKLGQDRLQVVTGDALAVLGSLAAPDAVFVGGGLSRDLLDWLEQNLPKGTRLVANAVTLDTETVLVEAQSRLGGSLIKLEVSETKPLGRFRGWKAAYPVVQWSVTL